MVRFVEPVDIPQDDNCARRLFQMLHNLTSQALLRPPPAVSAARPAGKGRPQRAGACLVNVIVLQVQHAFGLAVIGVHAPEHVLRDHSLHLQAMRPGSRSGHRAARGVARVCALTSPQAPLWGAHKFV
jgi:hypothetical protein